MDCISFVYVSVCVCSSQAYAASRVCMELIYNPQRKQNCKSHPQIFPTEVLVTRRHAVNSQHQAGLPSPWLPHAPGSWTRPWGPGHPWIGSEVLLTASSVASSAMAVTTNLERPGPAHQKCWLLSDLVLEEPQEAQVSRHPRGGGGSHHIASPLTLILTAQMVGSRTCWHLQN